MRAAIFIDGGYLLKQLQDAKVSPDYSRLSEYLIAPLRRTSQLDLMRTYFYYCPPWISERPTEDELRRKAAHERFVHEIQEACDRWQIRLGKLERRREGDKEVFAQKRVDVQLSVDLVHHTSAGHIQHAIIVAGDSDFIPAIVAAKESGATLTLWCDRDKSVHKELLFHADEVHYIDWKTFPARRGDRANQALAAQHGQKVQVGGEAGGEARTKTGRRRGRRGGRGRSGDKTITGAEPLRAGETGAEIIAREPAEPAMPLRAVDESEAPLFESEAATARFATDDEIAAAAAIAEREAPLVEGGTAAKKKASRSRGGRGRGKKDAAPETAAVEPAEDTDEPVVAAKPAKPRSRAQPKTTAASREATLAREAAYIREAARETTAREAPVREAPVREAPVREPRNPPARSAAASEAPVREPRNAPSRDAAPRGAASTRAPKPPRGEPKAPRAAQPPRAASSQRADAKAARADASHPAIRQPKPATGSAPAADLSAGNQADDAGNLKAGDDAANGKRRRRRGGRGRKRGKTAGGPAVTPTPT